MSWTWYLALHVIYGIHSMEMFFLIHTFMHFDLIKLSRFRLYKTYWILYVLNLIYVCEMIAISYSIIMYEEIIMDSV